MKSRNSPSSLIIRIAAPSAFILAILGGGWPAEAADVRLLSAAAMQSVFKEIAGDFERGSGHRLIIEYGTIGGITQRIQAGEVRDVFIGSVPTMAALAKQGRIEDASRIDLCRVGVGIVVPSGTSAPKVETVEDFKRLLLGAKTVVYAEPVRGGAAGIHIARVIERLGLAEQMKPKTKFGAGGDVTEVTLAQGEGAVGLTQLSEIVGKPAAELVGLLPDELQNYTVFTLGTPAGAQPAAAVATFIAFLKSPAVAAALKRHGMRMD